MTGVLVREGIRTHVDSQKTEATGRRGRLKSRTEAASENTNFEGTLTLDV